MLRLRALVLLLLCFSTTAFAHQGSRKHININAARTEIRVDLELVDAAQQLGFGTVANSDAILARRSLLRSWIESGIVFRNGERVCGVHTTREDIALRQGKLWYRADLRLDCEATSVTDHLVFSHDAQHESFVRFGDHLQVLRFGRQEATLLSVDTPAATARRFFWLGLAHLGGGYDHLLFVVALLLEVSRNETNWRAILRNVAWLVTAFTLGHSLSLALSSLRVVSAPSAVIEPIIAASIAAVALLHFLPRHESVRPRFLRLMTAIFGVIHGFGFGGALQEVGLPTDGIVTALLAFNLGIEAGQLVLVACVLPVLLLLQQRRSRDRIWDAASIAIASVALVWLWQRVMR